MKSQAYAVSARHVKLLCGDVLLVDAAAADEAREGRSERYG